MPRSSFLRTGLGPWDVGSAVFAEGIVCIGPVGHGRRLDVGTPAVPVGLGYRFVA